MVWKRKADLTGPKGAPGAGIESQPIGIPFMVVDQLGRRSWLESGPDGHPTPESLAILSKDLGTPRGIGDGSGLSFVLTDPQGRMSELQIDQAGRFTGPFPARVLAAATAAARSVSKPQLPVMCWGDSLTAGGWPTAFTTVTGLQTANMGIGGQTFEQIAARQGAVPAQLTFDGATIPATTTPIAVASSAAPYSASNGLGSSSGHGTVMGVPGTLTRDNVANTHTFTRDSAGTATWCPPGTPWLPDEAEPARNRYSVFWVGRNSFKSRSAEALANNLRAMVARLQGVAPTFLVLEIPPQVGEETGTDARTVLDAANAALKVAFPNEFVPVAQYLRGPALADAGITPTAQDTTDIGNGLTPTSLRSDNLHPNATGYATIGRFVAKIALQKGWSA